MQTLVNQQVRPEVADIYLRRPEDAQRQGAS